MATSSRSVSHRLSLDIGSSTRTTTCFRLLHASTSPWLSAHSSAGTVFRGGTESEFRDGAGPRHGTEIHHGTEFRDGAEPRHGTELRGGTGIYTRHGHLVSCLPQQQR